LLMNGFRLMLRIGIIFTIHSLENNWINKID